MRFPVIHAIWAAITELRKEIVEVRHQINAGPRIVYTSMGTHKQKWNDLDILERLTRLEDVTIPECDHCGKRQCDHYDKRGG